VAVPIAIEGELVDQSLESNMNWNRGLLRAGILATAFWFVFGGAFFYFTPPWRHNIRVDYSSDPIWGFDKSVVINTRHGFQLVDESVLQEDILQLAIDLAPPQPVQPTDATGRFTNWKPIPHKNSASQLTAAKLADESITNYRPKRLLMAIAATLATAVVAWSLALGSCWVVAGFRSKNKPTPNSDVTGGNTPPI
jgi:hypothetical protein